MVPRNGKLPNLIARAGKSIDPAEPAVDDCAIGTNSLRRPGSAKKKPGANGQAVGVAGFFDDVRARVALVGLSSVVAALPFASPADSRCAGAPNVVCSGADPTGFVSTRNISSLIIESGARVTDRGTGGTGGAGSLLGGVIEIFAPGPRLQKDIQGDVIINGTLRDTGQPGFALFVENDIDGMLTVNGTVRARGFGLFINDDLEQGFVNNGSIRSNLDALFVEDNLRSGGFLNTGMMVSNFGHAFTGLNVPGLGIGLDVGGDVVNTGKMRSRLSTIFVRDIRGDFHNSGRMISRRGAALLARRINGDFSNGGRMRGRIDGVFLNTVRGDVMNSGEIEARIFDAFNAGFVNGAFINTGMLQGRRDGVNVFNIFGGFENSGTVSGGSRGVRVFSIGGERSTFKNLPGGVITGRRGFVSGPGSEKLRNQGKIEGRSGTAIKMGGGRDRLMIASGSKILGDSFGGANGDRLIWRGGNVRSDFFEFEKLRFDHSSTGNLTGTVQTITNNISGGTLLLNGTLGTAGGKTFVNSGAKLGGTGDLLGKLVARRGGTVGPGNSIGTLNVAGNSRLAARSTYEAELGPGVRADRLMVSGNTNLQNGNVSLFARGSQLGYGKQQR